MEKNEVDPTASNSGKKFEPAFAPEWLKTTTTAAATAAGSSNQTSGSSLHSGTIFCCLRFLVFFFARVLSSQSPSDLYLMV